MQVKEKLKELQNNPEFEDFIAQFNRKLDTLTPMTEEELKEAEKELSGMSEEEAMAYLKKMFHLDKQQPYTRRVPKFGRNEPCFCGSGKKYKNCCQAEFEAYVETMPEDKYNEIIDSEDEPEDTTDIQESGKI